VTAREPDEIYERTRDEGRRRLSRPVLELAATAAVGGFDVAFGVAALALAGAAISGRFGDGAGDVAGAAAFGIGFVFVVVGRSELFTENFLVPITGMDHGSRGSWLKLGELWVVSLALNVVGGLLLALILSSHDVLQEGAGARLARLGEHIAGYGALTALLSAFVAGALMTLMTWFVEGAAATAGLRALMAWLVGFLLALGTFNHAVVSTVELIFAMRYGGDVSLGDLLANLGLAVGGNLAGGLAFVTLARSAQALAGR